MDTKKPVIYRIPIDDKFIIYAPLKPLAFIGNKALVDAINDHLEHSGKRPLKNPELMSSLEKSGLFDPDAERFPACDCTLPFKPSLCILMPTTACNLACTYCYAAYDGKKDAFLSWPLAKKAIEIAFENAGLPGSGHFALSFHGGGEPTLPKNLFFKASEFARKLDSKCPISVTTNAAWDKKFREKALDLMSEISISFDGNEITQNRQRPDKKGKGTFAQVMETIREIEKRKIPYGIRMTVTAESLPELRSNIEFLCSNTQVRSIQVEAVYNQGRAEGSGLNIEDVDSFVNIFMDVYHYARQHGRSVSYSAARPHLTTNTFCTATSNALIVTSDGELTACYEVFDRSHLLADDFIIGRLDVAEGITLYAEKREKLLAKIAANRNSCIECFCYYHCAGDCPPKAFMAQLSCDKFRCAVTRAITRELIVDQIAESDGFWRGSKSQTV